MNIHANSVKIKLKHRVMSSQKFSFFNARIDDLFLEYSRYESKKIFNLKTIGLQILDELTINKRFVNVLKFAGISVSPSTLIILIIIDQEMNGEYQGNKQPILEFGYIYERFSENPYDERKRINISLRSLPFELVLNKDLSARLNYMLKNPIVYFT